MKIIICSIFILVAVCTLQETSAATDKVVCYYGSWATYRPGTGKFDVEDINPSLCTHLIYTFIGLRPDGSVRVLDEYNDLEENWGKGAMKRFVNLKKLSPGVKTLVAIGGWNEGSETYSRVVADDNLRANFVASALAFLQKFGFDGFDLDWEYPNQRGGKQEDIENHVKVLKELRAAFDPHNLILTAAVAAALPSVNQSYNVPEVSKYLDMIHVMAYDLHGTWDGVTGQNAPLNPSSKDVSDYSQFLNVKACVEGWIQLGADPSKIILGMGTYGRSFTLDDPTQNGVGAPSRNPGMAGPHTSQDGMMGYNEIVELQQKGDWTVVWDKEQQVPYMYKGNQWIGYDDPESIALKMEYAVSMGLGGGMIWSLETEDFHGLSGTPCPLLRTINKAIGREIIEISTTTSAPTEPPVDPSVICEKEGFVRDPDQCSRFWYCRFDGSRWDTIEFNCPDGLKFNPNTNGCDYEENVTC